MKKQKASKQCQKLSHTFALFGPAYPSMAPVYLPECCWSLAPRCNCTLPGRPGWSPHQGLAAGLSLERSESPAPRLTPWQRAQQLHRHTIYTKQNWWYYWKEPAAEGLQVHTLRKGREQSGLSEFKHKEVKDGSQKKRSARILWRIPSSNNTSCAFKKYAHELQWWSTVFKLTTATGNPSQWELEAICSKIKPGFRCSFVSHFTRHMGLHWNVAKLRNETIPKTEQTNPLFTDAWSKDGESRTQSYPHSPTHLILWCICSPELFHVLRSALHYCWCTIRCCWWCWIFNDLCFFPVYPFPRTFHCLEDIGCPGLISKRTALRTFLDAHIQTSPGSHCAIFSDSQACAYINSPPPFFFLRENFPSLTASHAA